LSETYGIDNISTGDLLRREVAAGTDLGKAAKEYVDRGDLVPDELLGDMIVERLTEADRKGGFVLDGYPRNLAQAEEARKLAREHGVSIDGAVYLDVRPEELERRLLGRAVQEGRSDDDLATIRHRLDVFEERTRPLLDYFQERGLLVTVNGEQPPDKVTQDIIERLPASAGRA
jgi:adenylate kinase